jgi:glucose-6-phosphate 1-epimerase
MVFDFHTIGATLINWEYNGVPVLYCSDSALFEEGKAIRGGVPICFPWFGPKEGHSQHGFVRTREWDIVENHFDGIGQKVLMELTADEETIEIWPYDFVANLTIDSHENQLMLDLKIDNVGEVDFEFGCALHTYFSISNIHDTKILGLQNLPYISKTEGGIGKIEKDNEITIIGETDRVYNITQSSIDFNQIPVKIVDKGNNRTINVYHQGISDIVVWNPWKEKAASLVDMQDEDYINFICVEGAIASKQITLSPGASHSIVQRIIID